MRPVEYIKDKNAVLVPVEEWERMQGQIARLKKRVHKAEILSELKEALTDLKHDLASNKHNPKKDVAAKDFINTLRNAK